MLMNKPQAELKGNSKVRYVIFTFLLFTFTFATACRYDMQDQPRYKVYKSSDWFQDGRASRELPDGTIPRGFLRENKALYTGKIEGATGTAQTNEAGQQITFPDSVTEFPIPVTAETLETGEKKYKIYCSLCHGNFGGGDGMIIRRGFPKPPSYNDDRLRNAPVGHFFDVASNGWGKMSGYASQVSVADRWAIVAYIRALQVSQNPNAIATTNANTAANTKPAIVATPAMANTPANTTSNTNTSSNVKTNTATNANTTANTGGNK